MKQLYLIGGPMGVGKTAVGRALQALRETRTLSPVELSDARKVLTAAAMTYVAALLVSLAQLLRYVLAFSGRRRD